MRRRLQLFTLSTVTALSLTLACQSADEETTGEVEELAPKNESLEIADQQEGQHLTLFYSNDVRGRIDPPPKQAKQQLEAAIYLRARLVGRTRERLKRQQQAWLALDAGNLLFARSSLPATEAAKDRAKALAATFVHMGYDAVGLGEQELAAGLDFLEELVDKTKLPLVCSNIVAQRTEEKTLFTPHLFFNRGGLKLGVFAVVDPELMEPHKEILAKRGFRVAAAHAMAEKKVKQLREMGADLVVALSHQPWKQHFKLANSVKGVDLIVAGGDSNRTAKPIKQQTTYILQTPQYGNHVGILRFVFRQQASQSFDASDHVELRLQLARLQQSYASDRKKKNSDPQVIKRYKRRIDSTVEKIATIEQQLNSDEVKKQHLLFNKMIRLR